MGSKERKCTICGSVFESGSNRANAYCSVKCKNVSQKANRNEWKKKKSKELHRAKTGFTVREEKVQEKLIEVLKLKNKYIKQKDIADQLNITQQYVSKLIKRSEGRY